jgi:hypothetical protein
MTAPQGSRRDALLARIDRAIRPFDIAGLLDGSRREWFPVLAEDLLRNRSKLDATVDEIHKLLTRTGFNVENVITSTNL